MNIFLKALAFLGKKLPIWVFALAVAGGFGLSWLVKPAPDPITEVRVEYVDRPYPVDKEVPVFVPQKVTVYQPSPADTVVKFLVPLGLEYAGAIPANALGLPAVSYTRSEIVVPVANGGKITEYSYSLNRANLMWSAEVGVLAAPMSWGPTVGVSLNWRRFWLTTGLMFDVTDEHIGAPRLFTYARWRF